MNVVWYPAKDSQQVVGRVVEIEKPHPAKSREAKRPVNIMVPVMESKVAGSHDISHQELKDWNRQQICDRFPGAWEAYERAKGDAIGSPPEVLVVDGTPIDRADWIPREKLAWLKLQGFSTVEQLANMSDAQMQTLGPGARSWQKKAKNLLQKG